MAEKTDKPSGTEAPTDNVSNTPTQPARPGAGAQAGQESPGGFGQRPFPPGAENEAGHGETPPGDSAEADSGEGSQDPVVILNGQVEDLTKRLLTAHADIQNLHKRLERERSETAKYAITNFARDTVAVADNFERAITSVPDGASEDNPVLKALLDGVTMTEREFLNVLERHGVKRDTPSGELFDPNRHQAVMEENAASVTAGTILKVFQPGYIIEDRVLRPAMVVVARGGPKAGAEDEGEGGDGGDGGDEGEGGTTTEDGDEGAAG